MALLKDAGCSRGTTRTAFIAAVVILSIAYASGMIPLANYLRESDLMVERQPAYIHTTNHGGMDMDRDIYRDELPVTLEDLGYTVTEADHCSYEVKTDRSILMKFSTYTQWAYGDGSELPELAYQVVIPRWDWVMDWCWDLLYRSGSHLTSSFASEGLDPAPCGAEEAFYNRFPYGYCLRYEDRILILDQSQSLTESEFSAVADALK